MAQSLMQVENLTKSFGDWLLFADVSFGISEGDKTGIVARNGTGKTTLLRILAGKDTPDSGTITCRSGLRVGYLEQLPSFAEGATVLDACMLADTPVTRAVRAYRSALASGSDTAIAEAVHEMDRLDAWDFEDRLAQMLTQLDITDLSVPVANLSGGQRKRVALASVILDRPDLLILDEPTNHLDIGVIEWLENYLTRSRVTLLMVTHDRYFLDRVCTRIIEIDLREIFTYDGNYDYFLRRRAERYEALAADLDRVRNTLRREQDWMNRQPQARGGKAKYRIDAYHDLKARSRADYSERNVNLDVRSSYIGSKIFEAEGISKSFGSKKILSDFTYTFARYEKVGLIGPNGVGKSTFVKMLLGLVPQDSGRWNVGETVRFGYYSQEGIELDSSKRVIDAITDIAEEVNVNGGVSFTPMQFLKRFLFEPADQQKYISTLSGGERCRLQLATVLMRSPNFLILDEPTNDLDIMTLGILEDYLREFKGCVLVISHDRFFLDSIVDHLFVMEGDGRITDFPGGYSEWREQRKETAAEEAPRPAAATPVERPRTQRPDRMTYKEKKEFEALTAEIDTLTAEKTRLEALFGGADPTADIAAASARYEALTSELDEKELRWLELSEKQP
ncbi:MAG: ABC-F family ATP-binding cassette domain-containing protein [Bacteroides sp.]|nr:ABC-F family ATP-binding cassette domain-containing protein [Bacteroides sp.]